jgi:glycosyltransferase involved in cell wall biosynthesis
MLLNNLKTTDCPILFDGLHTTYFLDNPALANRKKIVRVNNIEHRYYKSLAESEKNLFKKIYYLIESVKLKRFEKILKKADNLLAVSKKDYEYFKNKYLNCELIFPFHPFNKVSCQTGSGGYVIYHGDFSVNENVKIADFLIQEVFSHFSFKCVIAGKKPPLHLIERIKPFNNIRIIPDPDEADMIRLIKDAHINLLPCLNSNGFKIKLLFSLFTGRHCIINSLMADSTDLGSLCLIADSGESMIEKTDHLFQVPFTEEMTADRKRVLHEQFDNRNNAKRIADLIFGN